MIGGERIMKGKQILFGGILSGVTFFIVGYIFSWITQTIWQYNVLELGGMRSINDPISISYFAYPWVLGITLSYAYSYFDKSIEGDVIKKGLKFGLLMWLVISFTSAFLVFSSMNYPIGFTVDSVIGSLLYMIVGGIVIAKIFDWVK